MDRLLLSIMSFIFLFSCQSGFEDSDPEERFQKSNFVLKRGRFPDRLIESELKPYLIERYGSDSFEEKEGKLFEVLRRVELVDRLPQEGLVASCNSYEVLAKDDIEDNLYKSSLRWYELRLLETAFSLPSGLSPKIYDMISLCLGSEKVSRSEANLLSSLENKKSP